MAAARKAHIAAIVHDEMWPALGEWRDFAWESGDEDFIRERGVSHRAWCPGTQSRSDGIGWLPRKYSTMQRHEGPLSEGLQSLRDGEGESERTWANLCRCS